MTEGCRDILRNIPAVFQGYGFGFENQNPYPYFL